MSEKEERYFASGVYRKNMGTGHKVKCKNGHPFMWYRSPFEMSAQECLLTPSGLDLDNIQDQSGHL